MSRETGPARSDEKKVSPKTRFQLTAFILAAVIAAVLYGMGPMVGKSDGDRDGAVERADAVAATVDLAPLTVGAVEGASAGSARSARKTAQATDAPAKAQALW